MANETVFALTPLFRSLKKKEAPVLEQVIKLYLPQVVRTARGAGLSEEQAQDVAQDVFLTFLDTLDRYEGRSHVRTWIFGILYRKIAEARRRDKRSAAEEDIDVIFESRFDHKGSWIRPPKSGDLSRYAQEIRSHMRDCMEHVPAKQRMAFILKEIEGFSTDEICSVLDAEPGNVSVMLFRARNNLRDCLESKGVQSE